MSYDEPPFLGRGAQAREKEWRNTISTISGSAQQAYADLKGTLNPSQQTQAKVFEEKLDKLIEVTETISGLYQQTLQKQDEEARTQRHRYYIELAIGIIIGIAGIVAGIMIAVFL